MHEQQKHELLAVVNKHGPREGVQVTAIPWLQCFRMSNPSTNMPVVYQPSLCFVVQGAKQVLLEDELYRYAAADYLVVSVDLPLTGHVTDATPDIPYVCLQIDIDVHTISDVVSQQGNKVNAERGAHRGLFVGKADGVLTDVLVRLTKLLDTLNDIPFLARLFKQELFYYLLKTHHGATIARMTVVGSTMYRIAHVIEFLKNHVHQPVHVDELADMAHMSTSSLHHLFKHVTAMSPLQYHKRLRLLEGRRLLLSEDLDVTTAGFRVGYESVSQFSREYRRLFGTPPRQDVMKLRARI